MNALEPNRLNPLIETHLPDAVIARLKPVLGNNPREWQVYSKDSDAAAPVFLTSELADMVGIVVRRSFPGGDHEGIGLRGKDQTRHIYYQRKENLGGPSVYPMPIRKDDPRREQTIREKTTLVYLDYYLTHPMIQNLDGEQNELQQAAFNVATEAAAAYDAQLPS